MYLIKCFLLFLRLKAAPALEETYLYIQIPKEFLSILNENTYIMYIEQVISFPTLKGRTPFGWNIPLHSNTYRIVVYSKNENTHIMYIKQVISFSYA